MQNDFTVGEISNRVIAALKCCPAVPFLGLLKEGHLNLQKDHYSVTLDSIQVPSLGAYCRATGISAYEFLYGNEAFHNLYSDYDESVIVFINFLDTPQQIEMLRQLKKLYPKNVYERLNGKRVSHRLNELLSLLPYGYLSRIASRDSTVPRYEYLSEPALDYLAWYFKNRSPTCVYPFDVVPSVASFLGVSLHLILDLDAPLYCETQEGDLLFDWYTLLNDEQKETFRNILSIYVEAGRNNGEVLTFKLAKRNHEKVPAREIQRIEPQSCLPVDFDELRKHSIPENWQNMTTEWVSQISRNLRTEFLKVLPSLPSDNLPLSLMDTKNYIDNMAKNAKANQLPVLHFLNYWSTMTGVSCHELMFNGHPHSVELRGIAKYFIDNLSSLPEELIEQIDAFLDNNRETIINPVYTLYMRSAELGAEQYLSVEKFWISLTSKATPLRSYRTRFRFDEISPYNRIPHNKYFLVSHSSMWWITLLMCPGYDIGLDFFVMQDYSHLATMDGQLLPQKEQAYLSSFLNASGEAQRYALAMLVCKQI